MGFVDEQYHIHGRSFFLSIYIYNENEYYFKGKYLEKMSRVIRCFLVSIYDFNTPEPPVVGTNEKGKNWMTRNSCV